MSAFNLVAFILASMILVVADDLYQTTVSKNLIESAREQAQAIIREAKTRAETTAETIIHNAKLQEEQIKQNIEKEKKEYHAFVLRSNETLAAITNYAQELYLKNQALVATINNLLMHLQRSAQASVKGKRAIKRFERLKEQTIAVVEQNIADPTLSNAIKEKIMNTENHDWAYFYHKTFIDPKKLFN
jgi:vacuolar-type H+-ATPase subunit H